MKFDQRTTKRALALILLVVALFNFSFDGVNSVTGVFIKDKFAAAPLTLGLLFVVVGIATAFVQAVLIERLVPRHGEKRMALVGLLASVIGWPMLAAAPALWMLFPIAFLQAPRTRGPALPASSGPRRASWPPTWYQRASRGSWPASMSPWAA